MQFDWHASPITRDTPVDGDYRNTQNVRRFMTEHCGPDFKFSRAFMAWIIDGSPKTMGDVAERWVRDMG